MAICGFKEFELCVKVCNIRYAGATGNSDFWRQDCVSTVHIIVSLRNCVSLFIGFLNRSIIPQSHLKVSFYRTGSDISCDGQVSVSCRSRCWLVEAHHRFHNLSYHECCWISAIMHIGIYTWRQRGIAFWQRCFGIQISPRWVFVAASLYFQRCSSITSVSADYIPMSLLECLYLRVTLVR